MSSRPAPTCYNKNMKQKKNMGKPDGLKSGQQTAGAFLPGLRSGEEACRCKEAAGKTPLELLKTMFDDLSFWRKPGLKKSGGAARRKTGGKRAG